MSLARIVVFGDTHLGFDSNVRARVERRRRGDDFEANFERVLAHAEVTRPDALVHCGDFFHHTRVHRSVADQAFERLARLAESGIPVLIVPGNHDRSKLPPSLWLGHSNVHVFDRPRTVEVVALGMRLAFAGFPFAWSDLRASFSGLVEETGVASTGADAAFLCIHHTVAGATVGPSDYTFRSGRDVIPRRDLPEDLAAILSGHIHRHQVLEGPHPPVFYPGSTERTSFAERDEMKGFLDLTVEAESGRGRVVDWRLVELPARPMVDLELPASVCRERLETFLAAEAAGFPSDALVRIKGPGVAQQQEALTTTLLRSVFPPTMNVQVTWEFARGRR